MLGVNYESSDDEEELPATSAKLANVPVTVAPTPEIPSQVTPHEPSLPLSAPVSGPAQGPTVSPPPVEDTSADDVAPGSPYTSNRALIQNLTLPTVPNFDIPPSPPGSPPQRATKKFAQFLELKKKGQHFNQRLEGSSVLRDPGHSQKLMDFAGISELEQYASTLPEGLAVPTVFPRWAYVEELRASQKQMLKAKEQDRSKRPREAIDFVSATSSGTTSRTNTPGKASASQSVGKRKELEHRSREGSSLKSGRRSASRSPKRRR